MTFWDSIRSENQLGVSLIECEVHPLLLLPKDTNFPFTRLSSNSWSLEHRHTCPFLPWAEKLYLSVSSLFLLHKNPIGLQTTAVWNLVSPMPLLPLVIVRKTTSSLYTQMF